MTRLRPHHYGWRTLELSRNRVVVSRESETYFKPSFILGRPLLGLFKKKHRDICGRGMNGTFISPLVRCTRHQGS